MCSLSEAGVAFVRKEAKEKRRSVKKYFRSVKSSPRLLQEKKFDNRDVFIKSRLNFYCSQGSD